jgi:hypothetical protein
MSQAQRPARLCYGSAGVVRTSRLVLSLAGGGALVSAGLGCASVIGITDIVLVDGGGEDPDRRDGAAGDAASRSDGAASAECATLCARAMAEDSCKAAPTCDCLFQNEECANRSCYVQNTTLNLGCGEITCRGTEGERGLSCSQGSVSCT